MRPGALYIRSVVPQGLAAVVTLAVQGNEQYIPRALTEPREFIIAGRGLMGLWEKYYDDRTMFAIVMKIGDPIPMSATDIQWDPKAGCYWFCYNVTIQ